MKLEDLPKNANDDVFLQLTARDLLKFKGGLNKTTIKKTQLALSLMYLLAAYSDQTLKVSDDKTNLQKNDWSDVRKYLSDANRVLYHLKNVK